MFFYLYQLPLLADRKKIFKLDPEIKPGSGSGKTNFLLCFIPTIKTLFYSANSIISGIQYLKGNTIFKFSNPEIISSKYLPPSADKSPGTFSKINIEGVYFSINLI